MRYRRIRFLKKYGDIEWLAKKRCPSCKTRGRLCFGLYVKERLRCLQCGFRFKIKGRPVKLKEGVAR